MEIKERNETPISVRLQSQMKFLNEVEKLKVVYRRNKTIDLSRSENSAEHSWHVALMALILSEHADTKSLDMFKVVKMLLVHDLVEIYAGDTWIYDLAAIREQKELESEGAKRLFALLPADQGEELNALWQEFEQRATPEAAFAASIDALQPLSNHLLSGSPDDEERPAEQAVLDRKRHIGASSTDLWQLAQILIEESTNKGLYS